MIKLIEMKALGFRMGAQLSAALVLMVSLSTPSTSQANRLDLDNHNLLIEKLESSRAGLGPRSREYHNITLRLADLLADRARLQFLEGQLEAVKRDRAYAVKLYGSLMSSLKGQELLRVLMQKAHLEETLGSPLSADESLTQAIRLAPRIDKEMLQKALAQRGELHFRQQKFRQAKLDFERALSLNAEAPLMGYWNYRLAWSELNLGNHKRALALIKKLLSQPDLLVKINSKGEAQFDEALHADALGDLVIFMARDQVHAQAIQELLEMTPTDKRFTQLKNLALELERLGRKAEAILAWDTLAHEGQGSALEILENRLHTTQLKWDLNQKNSALKDFQEATELWSKAKCSGNPKCEDYRKLLKNFVIVWHKTEIKKPTPALISAYQSLLTILPEDADMHFQAGEASAAAGKKVEASQFYMKAAELSGNTHKLSEISLIKALEQSEKTKNQDLRMSVYNFYLKQHPQGQVHIQVRYQKAHLLYTTKKYDQALSQFKELVDWPKLTKQDQSYQVLAADLALDILAARKADEEINRLASDWANRFSTRRDEYRKLSRQALLRISSQTLKNPKADLSVVKNAFELIQNASLSWTDKEGRDLVINQIMLAERLKSPEKILNSAQRLLKFKNLGAPEIELAKSYLVWSHELLLNFGLAYKIARTMKWPKLSTVDRELKLALLAELAQGNAAAHYKKALKLTRSISQANRIRASLVRIAQNPWAELRTHQKRLNADPTLLSELVIYAFNKTGNMKEAQSLASRWPLSKQASMAIFHNQTWMKDWKALQTQLSRHKLISHTDRLLKTSLNKRMGLLQDMEKHGLVAQKRGHLVGQVLVGQVLAAENERLYKELLKLPTPARLKGAEAKKYQTLLKSQALPYLETSKTLNKQANQLLESKDVLKLLESAYQSASSPMQSLIRDEWEAVATFAKNSTARSILNILSKKSSTPTVSELARAQTKLKNNPFDISLTDETRLLAEQRGQLTLATYLDERKSQIKERSLQ